MYTRCPQCQTIFKLSEAERTARGGLVRCGRCATVFQSNNTLLAELPRKETTDTPQPARVRVEHSVDATAPGAAPDPKIAEFPLLGRVRRPRTRTPFWILGNLLLLLLLSAQGLYFYGATLAQRYPPLSRIATDMRQWLGLRTVARTDISLIDLERAQIALRPNLANALRITATLVNRASYRQPFPLLEVTFNGNGGEVIARRVFYPREYLGTTPPPADMPPNVAVPVSFDVLNPGNRAVGYEIQIFSGGR